MQAQPDLQRDRAGPLTTRYLRELVRIGAWRLVVLHYVAIAALGGAFWSVTAGNIPGHPEILVKLLGVYCFLIGTIALPLVASELFPSPGDTDPGFDASPVTPVQILDARLFATGIVSLAALLPVIPIFLLFDPLQHQPLDLLDTAPFFQAVITSLWVNLVMQIATPTGDRTGGFPRRLAVVGAFILMHICLVGLIAQLSPATLQYASPLKMLIDINPFSQIYILMEGPDQLSLLFNAQSQEHFDYRLHLLLMQTLFLLPTLAIYRAILQSRHAGR